LENIQLNSFDKHGESSTMSANPTPPRTSTVGRRARQV
jgi:hypothetical protein